jgi:hypothetical protein
MKLRTQLIAPICGGLMTVLLACGDDDDSAVAGTGGNAADSGSGGKTSGSSGTTGGSGGSTAAGSGSFDSTACDSETTDIDKAVCAANGFLGTLSSSETSSIKLEFSDSASRTKWSNLPGVARAGLKMGDLSATTQQAALAMMRTVLSDAGVSDLTGVRAADDYLGSQSSSGMTMGGGMMMAGGGSMYSSNNYYVAVFGTPSTTKSWEITFGGHHMAYNVTFLGGQGYPVPNHIGVEPKASFTINGSSYEPLTEEGSAIVALFKSLSTSDLGSAYLDGQTFADVLIGPVEYGTGSEDAVKAKYPSGDNRKGVKVSSLSGDQRVLVKKAIEAWVGDYASSISGPLITEYTSDAAYADTLLSWGGTQSSGIDVDADKVYVRIDGPRLWIEVACQAGVVIQGKTHYHTIFRDKQYDYGGTL